MGDMADDYYHQQLSESMPYSEWNPRGYKEAPTAPQPDFEAINKYLDDAPVPTENRVVLDVDDPRVFNPLAAPPG